VRVERELVLRLFPPDPSENAPQVREPSSRLATSTQRRRQPTKLQAVALALKKHYDERPPLSRPELWQDLRNKSPELGGFSDSTLKRAIDLAWLAGGSDRVK
jgi:hypothetical protein